MRDRLLNYKAIFTKLYYKHWKRNLEAYIFLQIYRTNDITKPKEEIETSNILIEVCNFLEHLFALILTITVRFLLE